jgi:hypothetical protein
MLKTFVLCIANSVKSACGRKQPSILIPAAVVVLAAIIVCSAIAFAETKPPVPQMPYNFFPISYWVEPPNDAKIDARLAEIAECNFTVANGHDIGKVQKCGLKALVHDDRINQAVENPGAKTDPGIDAAVKKFASNPAFFGFYLTDEPNTSRFAGLAHVNQRLMSLDKKGVPFINLFPTYATAQQLGSPTYEEYVEQYLSTVKPRMLSYDHYALGTKGDRPDYFTIWRSSEPRRWNMACPSGSFS